MSNETPKVCEGTPKIESPPYPWITDREADGYRYLDQWETWARDCFPGFGEAIERVNERLGMAEVVAICNSHCDLFLECHEEARPIREERDALRAEVAAKDVEIERLAAERDKCTEAFIHLKKEHVGLRGMFASLEAELARLRGEGPIRVGDVVQVRSHKEFGKYGEVVGLRPDGWADVHFGDYSDVFRSTSLARVGRAVRMPDGTPVDPATD